MRGVLLATAGHAHVEHLPVHARGHDQPGGVDRHALAGVDVPGVGELGALLQVGHGHAERGGPPARPGLPLGDREPVLSGAPEGGQPERVPVGQPLPARVDARVQPGPHQVTGPGRAAVPERDLGLGADLAALDPAVPDQAGQPGGLPVAAGQQQRLPAPRHVGHVQVHRVVVDAVLRAVPDPAAGGVLGQRHHVAVADPHRGGPLPRLPEPADLGQLPVPLAAGDEREHPAGLHRGQLPGVADADHPHPDLQGKRADPGQVLRGHLGGLVDHQDVARPGRHLAREEPGDVPGLGEPLRRGDPGRVLRQGQADDPAAAELRPRLAERGHHVGFPGPGRSDQAGEEPVGSEHRGHGPALLRIQAGAGQRGRGPALGDQLRHSPPGGLLQDPFLGVDVRGGGEPLLAGRPVHRRAVLAVVKR